MLKAFLAAVVALSLAFPVLAGDGLSIKRIGAPGTRYNTAIWAGDMLYVSGMMADPDVPADRDKGTPPAWTSDTRTQATGVFQKIERELKEQGLGLGDIIQMQVFLAGDPQLHYAMDFDGLNIAYDKFFGTPSQPNKPVRATVQVAHLAAPGGLVEIMVTAARPAK